MAQSQVTPMDIEISNERAAELTAARTEITRLSAGIATVRDELWDGLDDTSAAIDDPARDSSALRVAHNRMVDAHNGLARLQPATAQQLRRADLCDSLVPFTGQGNRLGE